MRTDIDAVIVISLNKMKYEAPCHNDELLAGFCLPDSCYNDSTTDTSCQCFSMIFVFSSACVSYMCVPENTDLLIVMRVANK